MNAGTSREINVRFFHPAPRGRFLPLVHQAMRELEEAGPQVFPTEYDAAGNFIERFTSRAGVQVTVRTAPVEVPA